MAFRNRSAEHHQTEFKIPRVQKHKTEFENHFPFLDRRTPAHSMTVPEAQRHLKKIRTVANWLDNAVPYSPIPIGLDTFVVCESVSNSHTAVWRHWGIAVNVQLTFLRYGRVSSPF
jgi:hypothetical protein